METIGKHDLLIVLPPEFANSSVKVFWGENELHCTVGVPEDTPCDPSSVTIDDYVFIWNNGKYKKISFGDIIFLKADRSYCEIHYGNDECLLISFPLTSTQHILPPRHFFRINRSYIVNLKYVDFLMGNTLYIKKMSLTIGRDYRENVISRFSFLGIRSKNPLRKT